MRNKKRVLLIASGGGHWVQLTRLSSAFSDCSAVYVTTLEGVRPPTGSDAVYVVQDASRSRPDKIVLLLGQLSRIIFRSRPDFIITTGAAPGLLAIMLGKVAGAKTVWIDSLANSEELSLSGRIAGWFADLWLTQWPHLTGSYPKLRSFGSVL